MRSPMSAIVVASTAMVVVTGAFAGSKTLADALFGSVPAQVLSAKDRREIAEALPMVFRNGHVEFDNEVCAGRDIRPEVRLEDLNGDGRVEVLVLGGDTCSSGTTGQTLWMVVKHGTRWTLEIDVVTAIVDVAPTRTDGWADLHMQGRSHCIGVWTRQGGKYGYARSIDRNGSPCTP